MIMNTCGVGGLPLVQWRDTYALGVETMDGMNYYQVRIGSQLFRICKFHGKQFFMWNF